MKISLQQAQLKAAVLQYLTTQGLVFPIEQAEVEFTVSRKGGVAISAEVALNPITKAEPAGLIPRGNDPVYAKTVAESEEPAPVAPAEDPVAEESAVAEEAPALAVEQAGSLFG